MMDPDPAPVPVPEAAPVPDHDPEAEPMPDHDPEAEPMPGHDPVPVPEAGPRSPWKARIRVRVTEARSHLDSALRALNGAAPHLDDPLSADPNSEAATRTTIEFLMLSFKAASHHLIVSAALAHGAEIFALHAGSDDPTQPLPYIHLLGGKEEALQSALNRLHCAMGRAMDAYRSVQCSRGHLATALVLLDHTGLPCFATILDRERSLTLTALETAILDTSFCVNQLGLAAKDMDAAN